MTARKLSAQAHCNVARIRTAANTKQLIEAIVAKLEGEISDEREKSAGKVAGAQVVKLLIESAGMMACLFNAYAANQPLGEIVNHMVTPEFLGKIVKNTSDEHSSRVRLLSVEALAMLTKHGKEFYSGYNFCKLIVE